MQILIEGIREEKARGGMRWSFGQYFIVENKGIKFKYMYSDDFDCRIESLEVNCVGFDLTCDEARLVLTEHLTAKHKKRKEIEENLSKCVEKNLLEPTSVIGDMVFWFIFFSIFGVIVWGFVELVDIIKTTTLFTKL